MDESRILIVGAYGQLGKALQARFPQAIAVDRDSFDITDWDMMALYDWTKVDTIINAAVFANVDGAETPEGREAAWKINAHAPGYLAKLANLHDLTLVHVSTDYVFDGTKAPHTEAETFSPLGVYAQTKAAGDIAVSVATKHYIARTSWLIGDGPNFVRTMLGLAAKNVSPTVVHDQVGRLTFTNTLVDAIEHLLKTDALPGTYNVSNSGKPASWADITRAVFKEIGRDDLTVTNTTTEEYFKSKPTISPRPLKSELDLEKITATGLKINDWRDELRKYIATETKEKSS